MSFWLFLLLLVLKVETLFSLSSAEKWLISPRSYGTACAKSTVGRALTRKFKRSTCTTNWSLEITCRKEPDVLHLIVESHEQSLHFIKYMYLLMIFVYILDSERCFAKLCSDKFNWSVIFTAFLFETTLQWGFSFELLSLDISIDNNNVKMKIFIKVILGLYIYVQVKKIWILNVVDKTCAMFCFDWAIFAVE